ncbi:MAG: response regulator [Proteobacteria bacterium]|nr:response regulator [Pseudomonadota bacterium]
MKKILIVDDEPAQRKVIAAALKQKGYATVEAEDGLQGLEQARSETPDLIISDVYMDNMNGFIMVETLRQDPDFSSIPVIMMTSAAQAAGAWQSEEDIEYLDKGFTMPKLIDTVGRLLKK